RAIVKRLYHYKAEAKRNGDEPFYLFVKQLLNSVYGKLVQLVPKEGKLVATTCWQPVYGAVITANTRIRISQVAQKYQSVVAVHTDSVISEKELPLDCGNDIGQWTLTVQGLGVILGCGCYQIEDKVRMRGFPFNGSLFELLNKSPPVIPMSSHRAYSWRLVSANGWPNKQINLFTDIVKDLNINFDTKRDWDGRWLDGNDVLSTRLYSMPKMVLRN
ncbi:unnamed protein product, partial [marine sediment metagenome]